MAGLSLRDKVRSSDIRRELGVEPLLLRIGRSQLGWFEHLTRIPPSFRGFPGTSDWEEARGRPRTCWRNYISHLAWERLGIPQEELASVAGDKEAWRALLSLLPPRPGPG